MSEPGGAATLAGADRARDPGRGGWYEVFYATVDLGGGRAAWLRWTLLRPTAGEPTSAVWACAFDRARPRWFAGRQTWPPDAWEPLPGGGVRISGAEVRPGGCQGAVSDAAGRLMRWELRWTPLAEPFPYFPAALERTAAASTFPIAAVPLAAASGRVSVDGEEIRLDGARCQQAHLFGGRHARAWGWVHALGFDDDPDGFLSLIWARPERAGGLVPAASALALRVDGQQRHSRGLRAVRWHDRHGDAVQFTGRAAGARVEGVVRAYGDRLYGVTYHDPGGTAVHCANTEVAELEARIRWGRGRERVVRCDAACGFERGGRSPMAEIWRPL